MKKSIAAGMIALPMLMGFASVQPSSAQQQKTYSFGAMFPLTGAGSEIGELFQRGLNMAVEKVNVNGGVDGWELKPVVLDHKATAQGGVVAMNQLVNLYHVPFVITSFASVALASQPMAARNQVLLLNVGGTSINLLNKPWLYNDQLMGAGLNEPLAQYMHDQGLHTAALLTSEDAYGQDNGIAFTKAWTSLGGTIVATETFPLSATDFTSRLTKIRAADPQLLYVVAIGDTQGLLAKQALALGIKAQLCGPLATTGLIKVAGEAANGFVDTGIATDPNTSDPEAKAFLDAYKQKYGSYPEWDSGTPYEATLLLASLIHDVVADGGDPQSGAALLKELEAHPSFQNYLSGGTVRFLADQGSTRAVAVQQIKNGEFVTVKIIQP